jgi:hypothetical protein
MVTNNLTIELDVREDKLGQLYYLGRLRFPGTIHLEKGATFLVFVSESGSEVLQVAINNTENTIYSKYSKKTDRLKLELDTREDQYGKIYYVSKININGYIDCTKEVVFIIFNAKQGYEELQIVGDIVFDDKPVQKKQVEVIYAPKSKDCQFNCDDYEEDEMSLCQTNKL